MEDSILTSTKKVLGLAEDYTAFDEDILMHINAALEVADQVGVGLTMQYIPDKSVKWEDLVVEMSNVGMLKTYIYLKVKSIFDPPPTSFAIEAMNKQIEEFEVRMRTNHENAEYAAGGA